jgi:putative selenium metabolism protein SsnA
MGYLLTGATLVTLAPLRLEQADLRIASPTIVERGRALRGHPQDEIIRLDDKLILPGMVCAHTHLYSALARGMPPPPRTPCNFPEILELVWWRLDRALDEETIYCSALAGAAEAAQRGTTCIYDHHASPAHIRGSLDIVREAVEQIGLRAVLSYEVTDRGTERQRDEGVEENRAFLQKTSGSSAAMFRGLVGAHASFTLSDRSLELCAETMRAYGTGLHIHAGEDLCDVADARNRHGKGLVQRLLDAEVLDDHTILAHGVHCGSRDIELAHSAGAWWAHNPRSNMNNQVGYAPVAQFADRLVLGTDGIGADMLAEARFGYFRAREARVPMGPEQWAGVLARNQQMAACHFGIDFAGLAPKSAADLVISDYTAPTPLTDGNAAAHLLFGVDASCVESVMAGGKFVVRNRKPAFDAQSIRERTNRAATKLWSRMREL